MKNVGSPNPKERRDDHETWNEEMHYGYGSFDNISTFFYPSLCRRTSKQPARVPEYESNAEDESNANTEYESNAQDESNAENESNTKVLLPNTMV